MKNITPSRVRINEASALSSAGEMLSVSFKRWRAMDVKRDMKGMENLTGDYERWNDAEELMPDAGKNTFSLAGIVPDAYTIIPAKSGGYEKTWAGEVNTRVHTLVATEVVTSNDLSESKLVKYGCVWDDFDCTDSWDIKLAVIDTRPTAYLLPPAIYAPCLQKFYYLWLKSLRGKI